MVARHRSFPRPAPVAGRQRREGGHGQATVTPVSRGAARGGRRGQEGVGWVAGWGPKTRERGREANKGPFQARPGAEEGAHYPMPRSHVGNKRTILSASLENNLSRERLERVNPMGAGHRARGRRGRRGREQALAGGLRALSP